MNWKSISKNCLASDEGYMVSRYALEHGFAYVARIAAGKILHSSKDLDRAKAACSDHFDSTQGKAA
ncbi:hypothetical protein [Pseudomonas chlororaphis]|uniref:hypothetical protein n=1 Tax=Pseudomonas chlororaphis TaxID=587753 RepID=UPI002407B78C|nr:hypothetical protein [Pseudomonas chlororaphis]